MPDTVKKNKKLNIINNVRHNNKYTTMRKRKLRIVKSLKQTHPSYTKMPNERLNERFIELLSELADIMSKKGEHFRAKAYTNAADALTSYPENITQSSDVKDLKNIGKTIISKLDEFQKTGTLKVLEDERSNPLNQLTRVFGIGPKKAKDLIEQGITSIDDLNNNQDLLTDNMKVGLKYFNDIETRIPREEIDEYQNLITNIFKKVAPKQSVFEIVGSYRRGKSTSGDIDIIISNENDNKTVFDYFIDALQARNIIIEVLSRGKTKSMTIARIPGKCARRIDFLYAPPSEYAFALLYFTGSKIFNTIQRQRALKLGYSLNEHGFYKMRNNKKCEKIEQNFPTEQSIFEFLNMEYREPVDRIDSRSVVILSDNKYSNVDLINKFQNGGYSALNEFTEQQLSNIIRNANEAYYGNYTPLLSDNEYDILKETTLKRFPNNHAAVEGHTNTKIEIEKNKAVLPYQMWSMNKIKPDTNILGKWKATYKGPYVLSCKLDGVSGMYSTDGDEPKLYTRGNGTIGQDVSHLIPYLNLPSKQMHSGIVLRGEFIIQKQLFETKYYPEFSNSRNLVAGVVNQKKMDKDKFADIDFVCYEVIKPTLRPSQQIELMKKLDVLPVQSIVKDSITNEVLSDTLVSWRNSYKYDIDGVICTDDNIYPRSNGNPDHAFAFKMVLTDQIVEAKVVNVLWSPSKDGYLKPRVQIEPVVLGGACIEYATGFNAKFVSDNKIGIGAIVKLVRSGDVIPHILEVTQPVSEGQLPDVNYIWNATNVDIVLSDKTNDKVVQEKNITGFFRTIGVEGLSSGNVKRLVDAGYDTVPKIINMNIEDFMKVEGFKDKLSTKISDGIRTKLQEATLPEMMQATNIFGRGFGIKRFQTILSALPNVLIDYATEATILTTKLNSVPGMAVKMSQQFVKNLPEFVEWMNDAGLQNKMIVSSGSNNPYNANNPYRNNKFVITGFRDKELVDSLVKLGAQQMSSVSKNTTFVIVKNKDETTGKIEEARNLGVMILTAEEVKKKLQILKDSN